MTNTQGHRALVARLARVAAPLATLSMLAGCGSPVSGSGGAIAVVAAQNVWGNIAGQIGGSHVSVTSIITDPNADPHTYETDPRAAAAISGASIVIENGAGYDDFADKLLSTDRSPSRDVMSVAETIGVSGSNLLLIHSPVYVMRGAQTIEGLLASYHRADAATFAANLDAFQHAYAPYSTMINAIRVKYGGTAIAYTERVAGYLVQAAQLRLATPATFAQAIEDGNDPSPADIAAMDSAMTQRTVRLLLYNSQVTSPATQAVRDLATANGIPVVGVAETIPAGEPTFQAWQIDQARAILAALGG
jgi:zinc/manganese transport system substrate-binding protein